nr:hypothetical protein [Saprospiraceae bacterium]
TFAYQYVNKNKATLAKDVDSFQKNFNVDDKVWKELVDFVISKHKTIDKKFDFNKGRKFNAIYLKAMIAKQLFGLDGFYKLLNKDDEAVLKAIEALNSPSILVKK